MFVCPSEGSQGGFQGSTYPRLNNPGRDDAGPAIDVMGQLRGCQFTVRRPAHVSVHHYASWAEVRRSECGEDMVIPAFDGTVWVIRTIPLEPSRS